MVLTAIASTMSKMGSAGLNRVHLRRSATLAVIALVLGSGSVAIAAGGDLERTVQALRAEPMSLFDWGLFRLEEELQSVRREDKDFIRVFYNPDDQRIIVDGVFLVEKAELDAINARRTCFVRHHAIKLTLGIIDTDRIHIAPAADFRLGMKFSHHNSEAWPELPDAATIGAALLESIHIRVGIATDAEQFPFLQEMHCEGALLSQDVRYGAPIAADITPE